MSAQAEPLRFLIHPARDAAKYEAIVLALNNAVANYPDTFDHVLDGPSMEDHYGYHDDLRSSVVLASECAPSTYMRLTIRPGLHPVFDELLTIMFPSHRETGSYVFKPGMKVELVGSMWGEGEPVMTGTRVLDDADMLGGHFTEDDGTKWWVDNDRGSRWEGRPV